MASEHNERNEQLKLPTRLPEDFVQSPPEGLTAEEAQKRADSGLDNHATADPGKSVGQILAGNIFTLFNLLNLALALCLVFVGSYRNMLFMGVVISNTLIGTVQELRAKRTLEKLRLLNAPTTHVMRGGEEIAVPSDSLVQGDVVILRDGDQVPADAVVLGGTGAANESLLTGESDAVQKKAGDWLMSGSYITEGRFSAQLVHVGDESYAARLTKSAREVKRPKSALMTDLNKLIRFVSVILVPIGVMLFVKQYFIMHDALNAAVPSTVAAMIGMIPEGLVLLTSMALAAGVIKLGSRQTLVQELYGIETLARADVLCLDKTGTITSGEMEVAGFVPVDAGEDEMKRELARFLGAFDAKSGTLEALRKAVAPEGDTSTAVLPFSSKRKKSAASFADGVTLVYGAPAFVLGEKYDGHLRAMAEEKAAQGMRVTVLARCKGIIDGDNLPEIGDILGLVLMTDALRDNAEETLRYFREQDVTVKVISGDDPRTVSAIAERVKLEGAGNWVDATTLETEEDIENACERYTVFGRVTPVQKRMLVEALKRKGHSVAMTGDGVNDIPALKAADCSIAMAGGSDAARHAAQLTLLNSDFASMPLVVAEGRRVINNIERAASLFLVKTLYSFMLSVLLLFLPLSYPFQPIQLTLVSSLTIGVPSFFLALEPNTERIRGRFLQTVLMRALPGAIAVAVCATIAMTLSYFGMDSTTCSTLATLSAGLCGLMVLFRTCQPFSKLRMAVMALMTAGFCLAPFVLGELFFLNVKTMGTQAWLIQGGLTVLSALVIALVTCIMRRGAKRSSGISA